MSRLDFLISAHRLRDVRAARVESVAPATGYTPESNVREFIDNDGTRWAVREIIPEMQARTNRTLLTRPGYENGWLSFRSVGLACRVAPYPRNWRTISEYELERWCMRAQDAARVMRKRQQ